MTITIHPWWKEANIYQIYPASFKDSNGDGIGDIPGILSRIDYISSIGADAIWICPMYNSPQHDMGYDISDFESVYPPYGTVEDMEAIIDACHRRGMRVLLDLVINHTSDEHAWFKESRSSKDNPKRDWYIWRSAKYDADGNRHPPNNWASLFGGSAWQWDELTQEYYLHIFVTEQPDLNWENAETREAIYKTSMHFWLQKGIDGFRIDVVNLYSKQPGLPDAPVTEPNAEFQPARSQFCNGPRMHEFLSEMYEVMSQYGATMTVGELPATHGRDHVLSYVSAAAKQLNMVFQFDIMKVGAGSGLFDRFDVVRGESWTLPDMTAAVAATQDLVDGSDGWVTTFLENHDQARSVTRWGSDATEENRVRSAKMLATLQATLSGTLFLYQGQELGMVNAPEDWSVDEYKDVCSIMHYESVKKETNGDSEALVRALGGLQYLARDHTRLPMSWDASPNAGFTQGSATPWMRVHDNYKVVNAQNQIHDKSSVLSYWKLVLTVRKQYADVLVHGIYQAVQDKDRSVFIYEKRGSKRTASVALNFSQTRQALSTPPSVRDFSEDLVVSTYHGVIDSNFLEPFEGRVWVSNTV
ncbi:hypothetical protein B0A52_00465 [Exophiala mesophila]|uniref:Alpha-glucosidase n=1 Tax=Exophiala mesophila TaxID=212818 RepID=A0A438NK48_EXOME|nr:hypothetical protein B0A52_00465 [Exophiala mesophila]